MRHLAFLSLLMTACSSCAGTLPAIEIPLEVRDYQVSYRVSTTCLLGGSAGSAVAVGPRHLLTAKHVVDCPDGLEPIQLLIVAMDGTQLEVKVDLLPKDDTDAARLVLLEGSLDSWASVSSREPPLGEEVCIIGGDQPSTLGMRKCGYVAPSISGYLTVALHVVPGNSGGPAFDAYGRVLGIVSKGSWEASRENYVLLVPGSKLGQLVMVN